MRRFRRHPAVAVGLVLLSAWPVLSQTTGRKTTPLIGDVGADKDAYRPERHLPARKLLHDSNPSVRLQAALALAKASDAEAVPVLIDLLAETAPAERKLIEEVLQEFAGDWSPSISLARDDDISRRIRRDAWAGWWKRTDGPALLAEFRKRTLSAADLAKIPVLIDKLGDTAYRVRQQAEADLVAYGTLVVPMLREATKASDLERRRRAERCLEVIAKKDSQGLPLAAARLLALRRPDGAAEALLAVLPSTEDENLVGEIQTALATLARRDVKAGDANSGDANAVPALVRALEETLPIRRLAAGVAIAAAGIAEHRPAARKLLRDPDPDVRQRVALALAAAGDKEAIPALIDILADLPRDRSEPALDALLQIAGDQAPEPVVGVDNQSRRKNRDAWSRWWAANSAMADLGKLTAVPDALGYTLIAQNYLNQNGGRVGELGRDGKPRWQIDKLAWPIDARMLGSNRVLIIEWSSMSVTERDLKGKVLWQYQTQSHPVNAQRLANGNTFIATQAEVLELDRDRKEIFRHNLQTNGRNLNAAFKIPNGEIVCFTNQGVCIRLDAKGKEIKSFPFQVGGRVGGVDVSPTGKILMVSNNQTVQAMNLDGKALFEVKLPNPTSASWLPNGSFLVASYDSNYVAEVNPQGRILWQQRDNYHSYRARRR